MLGKSVNGPKEIKKYCKSVSNLVNEIRRELHEDLMSPSAIVEFNPIYHSEQNVLVQKYVVKHQELVCEVIGERNVCYTDAGRVLSGSGILIDNCLQELGHLRKMIVNAKQEKKTDILHIKSTIKELYEILTQIEEFGGRFVDSPETHPTMVKMIELITRRKENYKKNRKQILKQANRCLVSLRNHIVTYKTDVETIVGKIIQHADECREFIRACRKHALIEFAASEWWRATHSCDYRTTGRQPMQVDNDTSSRVTTCEYNFSVRPLPLPNLSRTATTVTTTEEEDFFDRRSINDGRYEFIVTVRTTITRTEEDDEIEEESVEELDRYTVTNEFENLILTQEAIEAFEWEEAQMWYMQQQQTRTPEVTAVTVTDTVDEEDAMEED